MTSSKGIPHTKEAVDLLVQLYTGGMRITEAACKARMTHGTAVKYLKLRGVHKPVMQSPGPEKYAALERAYLDDCYGVDASARIAGMGSRTAYEYLRRKGLLQDRRLRKDPVMVKNALRLHRMGFSYTEIGKKLGVPESTSRNWILEERRKG